jgi:hypothetical protein
LYGRAVSERHRAAPSAANSIEVFDRSSRFEDRVMNIAVKSALAGLVVVIAHGCATPVEIADDVLPAEFGDAGPPAGAGGAGGGAAGRGGTGSTPGGAGVTSGGSSGAGVGGAGVGGSSGGSGMQAAAGTAVPGGAGGSAAGAGGAPALGGAAGTAGAAGATASIGGAAGTGTAVVFDPGACDFDDPSGCDDLACAAACPTGDGGSCSSRCQTLVTCVTSDPDCSITEDDPLCAARINGAATACTQEADAAGGANTTQTTQPAFVARRFVECICSVPRP